MMKHSFVKCFKIRGKFERVNTISVGGDFCIVDESEKEDRSAVNGQEITHWQSSAQSRTGS